MTAKVTVGGKTLYTMLVSAANTLENNKTEINDLNVFPVPDGDTGTNMSLTLGAVREIEPKKDESVRARLYEEYLRAGAQPLYERLQRIDPDDAAKIHPNTIHKNADGPYNAPIIAPKIGPVPAIFKN